jgi:ubiquinone/menaquinone biosynthesis C-methylase UbiE
MTEAVDVFDDPLLASVYDDLDPWAASDEFYLGLAREIGGAILDLGCGTGRLACRIAAEGLEVVGADPAEGMLGVARSRPGTEAVAWVQSDGQSLRLARRFDLITMTGHAFQALLSDADARAVLETAARHLRPEGQFVLETRNPAKRAWLSWTPDQTREVMQTPAQGRVEACYDAAAVAETGAEADTGIVGIAQHCRFLDQGLERIGRSRIRFIERDHLAGLLARAGLAAAAWYGDWHRGAFTPASKEIIAVTRRAG